MTGIQVLLKASSERRGTGFKNMPLISPEYRLFELFTALEFPVII